MCFSMAQYISSDVKQKVISAVRDDGKKVSDLATEHGVSTKTIYNWLRAGVSGDNSALQVAKLQREINMLYGLLGKLTAEASRQKK
jgi:transposase-like protein